MSSESHREKLMRSGIRVYSARILRLGLKLNARIGVRVFFAQGSD